LLGSNKRFAAAAVFARIAVIAAAMRRSGRAHGPRAFEGSFCEMATAFGRDI
jgi:hypothetical protein